MERYFHKKLVRDKIPEIIKLKGDEFEIRVMDREEFERELKRKLVEEATEVLGVSPDALPKELADVLELVKSIAEYYDIDFELIEEKQAERRKERGGFKKRIFLIWSTQPAGK